MSSLSRATFEAFGLPELLREQGLLRVAPTGAAEELRLAGLLHFSAEAPGLEHIQDEYAIELVVPMGFPRGLPQVRETAGRIAADFHHHGDGTLCLGAPARLRALVDSEPSLPGFVDRCLVPYLYGWSYKERHGEVPFGEIPHGAKGLLEDFSEMLRVEVPALETVHLASLRKRVANKKPCYCGSGHRLGRCHQAVVDSIRQKRSRAWFRHEWEPVQELARTSGRTRALWLKRLQAELQRARRCVAAQIPDTPEDGTRAA